MYNNGKTSNELWAVVDPKGNIVWTRGGSSGSPKIMVYESEKKALAALRNNWTKQVHDENSVRVKQVYPS